MNKKAEKNLLRAQRAHMKATHQYNCRAELLKAISGEQKTKFLGYLLYVYSKKIK